MPLPDPLPTSADELDALYQALIDRNDYTQAEFDRLMEARLRAWGVDPDNMSAGQLIGAMQESMNRMLINLHLAKTTAPDEDSLSRLDEVISLAEKLRDDINQALSEVGQGD